MSDKKTKYDMYRNLILELEQGDLNIVNHTLDLTSKNFLTGEGILSSWLTIIAASFSGDPENNDP